MLVRLFRATAATRNIPPIVLSTKEEAKVKAEAFALSANQYLGKLPDKLELIARIRHHSKGYISLLERNGAYKALEQMANPLQLHDTRSRDAGTIGSRPKPGLSLAHAPHQHREQSHRDSGAAL
jgi:DNA-binding response OmpR family regulator